MIALRADHNVDNRRALDDLAAFGLSDTAGYCDTHLAAIACGIILRDAQAAEFGVDFLRRLLADVTGVQNDEVSILGVGRLDESFRRQRVHHALCIVDIHLTAV